MRRTFDGPFSEKATLLNTLLNLSDCVCSIFDLFKWETFSGKTVVQFLKRGKSKMFLCRTIGSSLPFRFSWSFLWSADLVQPFDVFLSIRPRRVFFFFFRFTFSSYFHNFSSPLFYLSPPSCSFSPSSLYLHPPIALSSSPFSFFVADLLIILFVLISLPPPLFIRF